MAFVELNELQQHPLNPDQAKTFGVCVVIAAIIAMQRQNKVRSWHIIWQSSSRMSNIIENASIRLSASISDGQAGVCQHTYIDHMDTSDIKKN